MYKKLNKIHFIGIGGIGMSGIAELMNNLGYKISGSDLSESSITKKLRESGIDVKLGHNAANIHDVEVVVYSSAVPQTNPEIIAAKEQRLPIIPRAEMLNELMRLKTGIALSGTHGKTTTTSMTAEILAEANLDPTYVIGGKLNSIDSNAKLGGGEYLVFEACEAFGSFLYFSPIILSVLNIDEDHMEYYKTMDALRAAFLTFINKIPFFGLALLNNDDENVRMLFEKISKPYMTFGIDNESDFMAKNIKFSGLKSSFEVYKFGKKLGDISLNLPGLHNVMNSLAAIAVANELDVPFSDISNALAKFVNADRRFQIKGEVNGITVVDDYAHHPSELSATIRAAKRNETGRVIAVFQPHLFSRTQMLYEDFAKSLEFADKAFVLPIYPAREKEIPGVSSELITDVMTINGSQNHYLIDDKKKVSRQLSDIVEKGDIVIFLGAGDVWQIAEEFLTILDRKK